MRRSASLIVLCLVFLLMGRLSPASAKEVPFKGRVTATWDNIFDALFDPPATFVGGGPVTHMGKTTQKGWLVLEAPNADGLFPGYGSVTITAANGDQVSFDYVGLLNPVTGEAQGDVYLHRRQRAASPMPLSKCGTFDALIDLSLPDNQPMTVVLDGTI